MNNFPEVSVVIPTIGRRSLFEAVESALDQTMPILEVVVVADTLEPLCLPDDSRVRVVRTGPHGGSANARQLGVEQSRGTLVALLDDDDLWHPYKLERQLAEVVDVDHERWIISCRCAVRAPGRRERIWPRTPIAPQQPVADYLFRLRGISMGGALLQTSTLCFPRSLAVLVPLNSAYDSIHDEPGWLIELQNVVDGLTIYQVPECFSIYNVNGDSISRSQVDRTDEYLAWGHKHLAGENARVRGDYYLTSAVTAAATAHSLNSIRRAITCGFTDGRPGPGAIFYAAAKLGRTTVRRVMHTLPREHVSASRLPTGDTAREVGHAH